MNIIKVYGIRCNSFHGCLSEENIIGAEYEIDIDLYCDFSKCYNSDNLNDTINYVLVKEIVVKEMNISSKLIETVAYRIINKLKQLSQKINKCKVELRKINPPIEGDVNFVAVVVEE